MHGENNFCLCDFFYNLQNRPADFFHSFSETFSPVSRNQNELFPSIISTNSTDSNASTIFTTSTTFFYFTKYGRF
jgi:hypothetical protein